MRYHLIPVRRAIITKTKTTNVGEDVGKREPSYTAGGNANCYIHYGKQYGDFSEN